MKNEVGITLVALIVTIIILLILAGISIQGLTQTGLFENAKQAKNATENAQNTENMALAEYQDKILVKKLKSNEKYTIVADYTSEELEKLGYTSEEIKSRKTISLYDEILINK